MLEGNVINGRACGHCGVIYEKGDTVWIEANINLKGQINQGYPNICDDCKKKQLWQRK